MSLRKATSDTPTIGLVHRRATHFDLRRAVVSDAAVHEHQIRPMNARQAHAPAGTSRKRRREPVRQALVSAFTPATGEICMKWRE